MSVAARAFGLMTLSRILPGISVEYYTRLERGTARGFSESVLEGIARALQLNEAERAHLIDL